MNLYTVPPSLRASALVIGHEFRTLVDTRYHGEKISPRSVKIVKKHDTNSEQARGSVSGLLTVNKQLDRVKNLAVSLLDKTAV